MRQKVVGFRLVRVREQQDLRLTGIIDSTFQAGRAYILALPRRPLSADFGLARMRRDTGGRRRQSSASDVVQQVFGHGNGASLVDGSSDGREQVGSGIESVELRGFAKTVEDPRDLAPR